MSLLYHYTTLFFLNSDAVTASQRADSVMRIMNGPIHHAGLGLPTTASEDYKKSWGGDVATAPFVFDWRHENYDALYLSGDSALGIAYAVPTGLRIAQREDNVPSGTFQIELLSGDLPAISFPQPPEKKNMRSWLGIPGVQNVAPLLVKKYDPTATKPYIEVEKIGTPPKPFTLPLHQDIYRMRAFWCYTFFNTGTGVHTFRMVEITNQETWSDIYNPSSSHSADIIDIEGIRAVKFRLSGDRKYLEMSVLAIGDIGDAVHSQSIAPGIAARWGDVLTNADSRFYLEEFTTRWRVRNLAERNDS